MAEKLYNASKYEPKPIYNYGKEFGGKYIILDVFSLGAEPVENDENRVGLGGIYTTVIEKGKHDDWAVVAVSKEELRENAFSVGQYIESDNPNKFDALVKENYHLFMDAYADLEAKANTAE